MRIESGIEEKRYQPLLRGVEALAKALEEDRGPSNRQQCTLQKTSTSFSIKEPFVGLSVLCQEREKKLDASREAVKNWLSINNPFISLAEPFTTDSYPAASRCFTLFSSVHRIVTELAARIYMKKVFFSRNCLEGECSLDNNQSIEKIEDDLSFFLQRVSGEYLFDAKGRPMGCKASLQTVITKIFLASVSVDLFNKGVIDDLTKKYFEKVLGFLDQIVLAKGEGVARLAYTMGGEVSDAVEVRLYK